MPSILRVTSKEFFGRGQVSIEIIFTYLFRDWFPTLQHNKEQKRSYRLVRACDQKEISWICKHNKDDKDQKERDSSQDLKWPRCQENRDWREDGRHLTMSSDEWKTKVKAEEMNLEARFFVSRRILPIIIKLALSLVWDEYGLHEKLMGRIHSLTQSEEMRADAT